ncbi:ATP-binding protein [[Clostridium] spiroforme]|nr:ATP-binding protein [Thomasclavelia spiroformis]MBM6879114.1 ATP-binding protein [Thomasclavelia spiroformis]
METLKYIIEDSTIAELLGVQNFSTDEAAILELVKNAYDANALNLKLIFSKDELRIVDDGIGMNEDDIRKHWMHIGKSNKDYEIIDTNNNTRVQAGSKGVGRFALSRLGRHVSIKSKKDGFKGIIWTTDWNTSIIEMENEIYKIGTQIIISDLREKWNEKRIKNLSKYLEKMYFDDSMKIKICSEKISQIVPIHFPKVELGINCKSNIILEYKKGILITTIKSDEFEESASKYCTNIDLTNYQVKTNIFNEFKGIELEQLSDEGLAIYLNDLGSFSANFFFNFVCTVSDKEKFLYKYRNTIENIESGIILYRNAFSISSYEGNKDWLGLGKRSRKSPAAATHPTGSWRVRENQLAGYVLIDKKENFHLQDMANRQGLDENIYYHLFVEIILTGIKEFERYRQTIIRKINVKNEKKKNNPTPLSDKVIKTPKVITKLTKDEATQLAKEIQNYKKDEKIYKKEKEEVEARYRYDVRILNVLATTGLKASSIAHELKNDRNTISENYNNIVHALKEYDMWDELNSVENTRKIYKNVPYMLKSNDEIGKKLITFMDTILTEIEKKQFESKLQSVAEILNVIKGSWERDYVWINIDIKIKNDIIFQVSEDMIHVIMDNLILNSVQQNDKLQTLDILIEVSNYDDFLKFIYRDNGKGLDSKYLNNPKKILEVSETTRSNGHGLGMWIVNNTCIMSGGEVLSINGEKGFTIEFTIGGKI